MNRMHRLLAGAACIAALAFPHGSTAADDALTETQPRANAEVAPYLAQRGSRRCHASSRSPCYAKR